MERKEDKNQGLLMEIQKFCLHDGPGIRTTVFFKGCPLACQWCANPESQQPGPQLQVAASNCLGCGHCLTACQAKALSLDGQGKVRYEPKRCTQCQRCVPGCPGKALRTWGAWWTLEEAVQEIMKDQVFFQEGGGVTFSGGEVLSQVGFAGNLAKALKEKGVHVTCETCGFSNRESFRQLLDWCDLLYFDVKHWDGGKHVQGTGKGNQVILEHLRMAAASGIPMAARIPVIPRYNDSPKDWHGFGRLLRDCHVLEAHLLAFHQFGSGKYQQLGRSYQYAQDKAMEEKDLSAFAQALNTYVPKVQVGG